VWRAVALGAAGGGETALDGVKAELVSGASARGSG
jgi:hypothetical protein